MNNGFRVLCIVVAFGVAFLPAARACGFLDAPTPCEKAGPERESQWMLSRAAAAIEHEKAESPREFTLGEKAFAPLAPMCSASGIAKLKAAGVHAGIGRGWGHKPRTLWLSPSLS